MTGGEERLSSPRWVGLRARRVRVEMLATTAPSRGGARDGRLLRMRGLLASCPRNPVHVDSQQLDWRRRCGGKTQGSRQVTQNIANRFVVADSTAAYGWNDFD